MSSGLFRQCTFVDHNIPLGRTHKINESLKYVDKQMGNGCLEQHHYLSSKCEWQVKWDNIYHNENAVIKKTKASMCYQGCGEKKTTACYYW